MQRLILAMPGNEAFADRRAATSGAGRGRIQTRRFPDGERYVRLHPDLAGRVIDLACPLAGPAAQLASLRLRQRERVRAGQPLREVHAQSAGGLAHALDHARRATTPIIGLASG